MHELVHGLADVGQAGGLKAELAHAALERELPVDGSEVVRHRGDRAPPQVEPARGIAAGREQEEGAPRRSASLVLIEGNVPSRDRGEHDEADGQLVAFLVPGKGLLELRHPGRWRGHTGSMPFLLGTAGGFGADYDARPESLVLAADALPKLLVAALLVLALVGWVWLRVRSLER